jgi:TRAP-type C4-dicarboxylate transport system permease small subunit
MAGNDDQPAAQNVIALWYTRIFEIIGGSAMLIIVVVMAVQVLMRYIFNASLIWAEELCRYLMVWISFVLVGLAFQRGELVTVDLVAKALSPRARFILKLVASVPLLAFLYFVTTAGYTFANRMSMQSIPALDFIWSSIAGRDKTADVSIFWVYVSVAIGAVLLTIHIVVELVLEGRAAFGGAAQAQPPAPPAHHPEI